MNILLFSGISIISIISYYYRKGKNKIIMNEVDMTCSCYNCKKEENINIKNNADGNFGKNYKYNSSFYKVLVK